VRVTPFASQCLLTPSLPYAVPTTSASTMAMVKVPVKDALKAEAVTTGLVLTSKNG
jgi:D-alanine-D-alanine ligase-like ATP-grasp enzyme